MSVEHKRALSVGREEGRAIRRYLEAIENRRRRPGRPRSPERIQARLDAIDSQLADANLLTRVHLAQERIDLEAALAGVSTPSLDVTDLEEAFVAAAASYSARKGITYTAWREVGVEVAVLKRAGIARTRS